MGANDYTWLDNTKVTSDLMMQHIENRLRQLEAFMQATTAPPIAQMHATVTQSISPSTWVPLNFDWVDIDTVSGHDSSNPANYIVQVDGIYSVTGIAVLDASSADSNHRQAVNITVNGDLAFGRNTTIPIGIGSSPSNVTHFVQAFAGDVINTVVNTPASGRSTSVGGDATSAMEIVWLSPIP